jgi:rhodanese-related sulfurtransferase
VQKKMFQQWFGKSKSTEGEKEGMAPRDVNVEEALRLQREGAQVIDVREPYEFAAGHASGARNIPLSHLGDHLAEVHRDGVVLLICQSGNRSKTAQGLLKRRGFTDVRNVRGGTGAWRNAHLPMD